MPSINTKTDRAAGLRKNLKATVSPFQFYLFKPVSICMAALLLVMATVNTSLKAQQDIRLKLPAKNGPVTINDQYFDTAVVLTERIYPFLSEINDHPDIRHALTKYKPLRRITRLKNRAVKKALLAGRLESAIGMIKMQPGSAEFNILLQSLIRFNRLNTKFATLAGHLHSKMLYGSNKNEVDSSVIRQALEQAAAGLAYAADVYLLGQKPTYGKIDGMTIDLKDPQVRRAVTDSLKRLLGAPQAALFYYLPLKTALTALKLNGRTEAVRYEPLTGGLNAAPADAIKKTDFSRYTYSAILVPGLGPEKPDVRLTAGGKARCRMAAAVFNKGEAAFLIVSGGHVHPIKTPFCEAVEMKKYMVDSLKMDETRILIEPYARHTTTNLRNATRLLVQTGMPVTLPVLIVTDPAQSAYINKGMAKTARRDLGYLPYKNLKILSPTQTVFLPNLQSLQANPMDPLDP